MFTLAASAGFVVSTASTGFTNAGALDVAVVVAVVKPNPGLVSVDGVEKPKPGLLATSDFVSPAAGGKKVLLEVEVAELKENSELEVAAAPPKG